MTAATPGFKTSLRTRILLALVLIVTMTSTLLSVTVLVFKGQLEKLIFADMVRDQMQLILLQVEAGTYEADQMFRNWTFLIGDDAENAAPQLRALAPGSHHGIHIGNRHYEVETTEYNGEPVYLTYDITAWENEESLLLRLLAFGVVVVLVIAVLLGRQASSSILAPVHALTARLVAIPPHQRKVRIAQDFQGSEIGLIASAFDQYLERLDQFVERERSFTAAASHELRTPLSVMMGAVDVLDSQQQTPVALRALARLRRACEDMRAFIEATLFLSREDSTTIHESPAVNVTAVIHSLIEDSQPLLQEHNIHVTTQMPGEFVVELPVSLIQIMIGNILRNAIEHTQNGNIDIRLRERTLVIADTGKGITAENLPHIFARTFTTKKNGFGLGLHLVKRICDRFGWRIRVESETGRGTTVIIEF